jgi:ABC-type nitrate/sulfonate/bicarbonate transport system permease component
MTTATRGRYRAPRPLTARGRAVSGIVGTIVAVLLVEILIRTGAVDGRYVPPPSVVAVELARLATTPAYWIALGQTLQGWALGFALAFGIAVPVGILISTISVVRHATRPLVEFLRPVPGVALIPVAILLFGTGLEPKVFLVTFACTWPLLVQTIRGLRDVDPTQLTTAASYRIPRGELILRVIIPAASPYIATGIRIAATTGILVGVTCELIIGSPGIGREITFAQAGNATVMMYALIATTGILGIAINLLILVFERRILRWHPSYREIVR